MDCVCSSFSHIVLYVILLEPGVYQKVDQSMPTVSRKTVKAESYNTSIDKMKSMNGEQHIGEMYMTISQLSFVNWRCV